MITDQTDAVPDPEDSDAGKDQQPSGFPWLNVTVGDLDGCDFEAPVAHLGLEREHAFSSAYVAAAREHDTSSATFRVFALMSSVIGMLFRPDDPRNPFGAMVAWADGRRSAVPEDFRGQPQQVIAAAAARGRRPIVKARLCDVAWQLDRKLIHLGRAAIAAYLKIMNGLEALATTDADERQRNRFVVDGREALAQALEIGRVLTWQPDEAQPARAHVARLRVQAIHSADLRSVRDMSNLDLRFGISEPATVGAELEALLDRPGNRLADDSDMWKLAARAYHHGGATDAMHRCTIKAAESLAAEAERAMQHPGSAMMAAHWLSMAIAELHGVPNIRERRTALRHRLIDIQAHIPDEMSHFSQEIDLRDIAEKTEEVFGTLEPHRLLFAFAGLVKSPQPDDLIREAKETIAKHPLSSMFPASHHDGDGKVIHRSDGAGVGDTRSGSAIERQIAQAEGFRRQIAVGGRIEVARQIIASRAFIAQDTFINLLHHSPFVPEDLLHTYARGFAHFFEGDLASALYVLTPMLENSLRHVLRNHGYDVTKFEDATQTQQDLTISALFEKMRGELETIFGPAIIGDIDRVFLAKGGPAIRHSVAHGLMHDGTPYSSDAIYACWLIFKLCCLPLVRHREEIERGLRI